MGWPDMPELPSSEAQMLHTIHDMTTRMHRAMFGEGGPADVGLAEMVRANGTDIKGLKADVAELRSGRMSTVDVEKTKWEVYGRYAEVIGIIAAVLMGLANTMGWL